MTFVSRWCRFNVQCAAENNNSKQTTNKTSLFSWTSVSQDVIIHLFICSFIPPSFHDLRSTQFLHTRGQRFKYRNNEVQSVFVLTVKGQNLTQSSVFLWLWNSSAPLFILPFYKTQESAPNVSGLSLFITRGANFSATVLQKLQTSDMYLLYFHDFIWWMQMCIKVHQNLHFSLKSFYTEGVCTACFQILEKRSWIGQSQMST